MKNKSILLIKETKQAILMLTNSKTSWKFFTPYLHTINFDTATLVGKIRFLSTQKEVTDIFNLLAFGVH